MGRVKAAAIALGGALVAAFTVRAITRFGREAVRVAREAGAIWTRLAGTVNNAGVSFDELKPRIDSMARAMQDATTVGDEDFAMVLQNLISTSQDVEGSLRNVSVVADLAAAKNMDLGAAAMLVGRAMVGQTSTLARYGIVVAEGADAVEVLREQFKGMAANEAATLDGMIKQLSNEWGDFKQAVGNAIIEAGNGTSIIQTLTAVIKSATIWVDNNRSSLTALGQVLSVVVRAVGLAFDGYVRLTNLLSGAALIVFASIVNWGSLLADSFALAATGVEKLNAALGRREASQRWGEAAENLRRRAAELRQAANDAITAAQDLHDDATRPRAPRPQRDRPIGTGIATTIGVRDDLPETPDPVDDAAKDAADKLAEEARRITEAVRTPAEVYAATLAMLQGHLDAGRISQETFNRAQSEAKQALTDTKDATNAVAEALAAHEATMQANVILVSALGSEFDALDEEARSIEATLRVLADEGIGPTDERFAGLVSRLGEVRAGMQQTQTEMETTGQVAETVGALVGAAFGAGIGPLAEGKARQNAILAAEQLAHGFAALTNPFTAATAGAHFAAAAKYTAVAGLWKALAGAVGGGGGGLGASSAGSPSADRGLGGSRTESMGGPEVHIHFVGEGFAAVNPEVQRVVYGAQQIALERYGPNARIKVHRRNSG
jgi:hypothetical protein